MKFKEWGSWRSTYGTAWSIIRLCRTDVISAHRPAHRPNAVVLVVVLPIIFPVADLRGIEQIEPLFAIDSGDQGLRNVAGIRVFVRRNEGKFLPG